MDVSRQVHRLQQRIRQERENGWIALVGGVLLLLGSRFYNPDGSIFILGLLAIIVGVKVLQTSSILTDLAECVQDAAQSEPAP